jgi:hypothetical protein
MKPRRPAGMRADRPRRHVSLRTASFVACMGFLTPAAIVGAEPILVGSGFSAGTPVMEGIHNYRLSDLSYRPGHLIFLRTSGAPTAVESTISALDLVRKEVSVLAAYTPLFGTFSALAANPESNRLVTVNSSYPYEFPGTAPSFSFFQPDGGLMSRALLPFQDEYYWVWDVATAFDPAGFLVSVIGRCATRDSGESHPFACADEEDALIQRFMRRDLSFLDGNSNTTWQEYYSFQPRPAPFVFDEIRTIAFAGATSAQPHGSRLLAAVSRHRFPEEPDAPTSRWDAVLDLLPSHSVTLWEDSNKTQYDIGPLSIAVSPKTDVPYFSTGECVYRLTDTGAVKLIEGFRQASSIAFDDQGQLYVVDERASNTSGCSSGECGLGTVWRFSPDDGYRLRAAVSKDLTNSEESARVSKGAAIALEVPLGAPFYLRLVSEEKNGEQVPVAATYTVTEQKPSTLVPLLRGDPLFPNHVIIRYDNGLDKHTFVFQALHAGEATIRVDTTDPAAPDFEVRLSVYLNRAASMGTHPEADDYITDLANRSGIPPQLIKGHIQKESNWKRQSYRYEPFSVDAALFSPSSLGAKCYEKREFLTEEREKAKYEPFAMPLGSGLTFADRDARRLAPAGGMEVDAINTTMTGDPRFDRVTAHDLYLYNPDQGWTKAASQCVRDYLAAHAKKKDYGLDFIAQTSLAASYGYIQVRYDVARDWQWRGVVLEANQPDVRRMNPSYLFDTVENWEIGGGSLPLGTGQTALKWRRRHGEGAAKNPSFFEYKDFILSYWRPYSDYNPGSPFYPSAIWQLSDPHIPRATRALFR